MLTFKLAWRSLGRHKRRTIITGSTITFSFCILLIFQGFGNGRTDLMIDGGVKMGAGHVLIQKAGFNENKQIKFFIADPEKILAELKKRFANLLIVPRVIGNGIIMSGSHSSAVLIMGVDPAIERSASRFFKKRLKGGYLREAPEMPFQNQAPDIYLGKSLAEKLDVDIGDRLSLTVKPVEDPPVKGKKRKGIQSMAFRVSGIFQTGSEEIDGYFIQVPLSFSKQLFNFGKGVNQIALIAADHKQTDTIIAQIKGDFEKKGLEVLSWREALAELSGHMKMDSTGIYFMMGILFVIVIIGILITLLMSIMERTREFGVMMAVGTSRWAIFRQIYLESAIIGFLASLVGILIGGLVTVYLHYEGINLASIYGDKGVSVSGSVLEGIIYSKLVLKDILIDFIFILMIIAMAAFYPAMRILKIEPIQAIQK